MLFVLLFGSKPTETIANAFLLFFTSEVISLYDLIHSTGSFFLMILTLSIESGSWLTTVHAGLCDRPAKGPKPVTIILCLDCVCGDIAGIWCGDLRVQLPMQQVKSNVISNFFMLST